MSTSDESIKGHRGRLRERFLKGGLVAVAEYEMLELVLFSAKPRGDVKPLAKALIKKFGSFAAVVKASTPALLAIDGVGDAVISALRTVEASAELLLKQEIEARPVIQSWTALLDYCRLTMAEKTIEEFRVIFLNRANMLIADEVQQRGTVDHTPIYPREIIKRTLELGATAIILVHNHPSGNPSPSKDDIDMTQLIIQAAKPFNIRVHDHVIVARKGHYSFKSQGLIS
ncbi:MAG: DNA repair protein RadC [Rickettsiales bacterium]|nr:DNA repair protein RadC [Rickettsiales bacterium]